MKKILYLLLLVPFNLHATEARLRDGKIEFAVGILDGTVFWTPAEKSDAQANIDTFKSTSTLIIVDLVPTALEQTVADSGIRFFNFSEYYQAINDKIALEDKLADLKPSEVRKKSAEIQAIETENNKR